MVQNPPENFPRITPYLLYENLDAAVDWLVPAFGFTERVRMKGPDGKANHAELGMGDGVVMMGHPGADYQGPHGVDRDRDRLMGGEDLQPTRHRRERHER